jgi:hypothetical protein
MGGPLKACLKKFLEYPAAVVAVEEGADPLFPARSNTQAMPYIKIYASKFKL